MATLPVKWFDNRFHGIPILNGTPGSMVAVLDAVLVNGFGNTNAVTISVTNKKATIILQDGVTFFRKSVVAISGFSNQAYNSEYQVQETSVGKIVISLDAPNGTIEATGVVVKYAPLGWFKPFSGVSKAIYKPSKVDAQQWMFYVDDTYAKYCKVAIMENATSLENHVNPRPRTYNFIWGKSYYADTNKRTFAIIGDPYCFYYKTPHLAASYNGEDGYRPYGVLLFVGEPVRFTNKPDPFGVFLFAKAYVNDSEMYSYYKDTFDNQYSGSAAIALRTAEGLKTGITIHSATSGSSATNWTFFDGNLYYTSENIVLFFTDNYFYCSDRRVFRIPGAVSVNAFPLYNNFDYIIEAKDNELNRDLIFTRSSQDNNSSSSPNRVTFFDITGPWR